MRATLVDENKNLVWSEVPDPVIGEEDVLVKIHAAALNRADHLQRQGKDPSPLSPSDLQEYGALHQRTG